VRIGVSLVKGLAFGKNKPCISVSTLEALAENIAALDGILLPCMDARRAQVYNAVFSSDGNTLTRLTEDRAVALTDLCEEMKNYPNRKIYLSGDGYKVAKGEIAIRAYSYSKKGKVDLLMTYPRDMTPSITVQDLSIDKKIQKAWGEDLKRVSFTSKSKAPLKGQYEFRVKIL
jgi:tRNA threonylcarbamoyl adenosine modification protein YeaZ